MVILTTKETETTFHTCETDDDILIVGTKGEYLQPRDPQLYQNQNGRFNNGNANPQVFPSKSPTWTQQRPSVGATPVDVSQGLQYNRYVTPPTPLQSNSQQTFGDYVPTLTLADTNMYGRQLSRTSVSLSGTPNLPAKQQQQRRLAYGHWTVLLRVMQFVPCLVNSTTFQFGFQTFFG
ncbi:unnamed protein product [Eruca vesicaria subsp. sativa]|uniref:Uncharacterized protein n=1 Tax=Eruca vesicaria subsp. sativa TaxID=29727 RepID=A0ABC8JJR4_ERUVS|nr:unnamed protein product [Eruca vesicaria subsp. sativa]